MKKTLQWLFPPGNYDAILAAFAGFFIIQAFTHHSGIGVSPDSVVYMSSASNFLQHGMLKDYQEVPIADFPCFYPLFLSAILFLTRMGVMQFAPILNGLLFALLIYLSGWIMERFLVRSKVYKWLLLIMIVSSPCLLEVYSMLWSETLFIVWILLLMPALRYYLRNHSLRALLLLALIVALSCITRYAGITLAATAGLFILLDGSLNPLKKTYHLFIYGVSSLSLLALNLLRNRMVNGTLTGFREKGVTPFQQNLHDLGSVFCDWLPFFNGHYKWSGVQALCWFLLLCFVFIRRFIRKSGFYSYENLAIAYFIIYFVFILLTATLSRFQMLNSRLLSPLFIPWIWGASSWLPPLAKRISGQKGIPGTPGGIGTSLLHFLKRRGLPVAGVLAACCFLRGQQLNDWETWDGVKDAGIPGYTEDPWRDSETLKYLKDNRSLFDQFGKRYTLYTNANDAIWFLTGLHADMIPHKDFKKDIQEFLDEKTFYIFWFNDASNPDLLPLSYISSHAHLVEMHTFKDGVVYKFGEP